ncbi:MAG: hypothetical protein J7559_23285, partial [Cohnella sp.]|nr:hypothetical protein [Cohnella sp.]
FTLSEWATPLARDVLYYSPFVSAMEMMRYGIFGDKITPYYNYTVPVISSLVLCAIGLVLCRRVRRTLVVE